MTSTIQKTVAFTSNRKYVALVGGKCRYKTKFIPFLCFSCLDTKFPHSP